MRRKATLAAFGLTDAPTTRGGTDELAFLFASFFGVAGVFGFEGAAKHAKSSSSDSPQRPNSWSWSSRVTARSSTFVALSSSSPTIVDATAHSVDAFACAQARVPSPATKCASERSNSFVRSTPCASLFREDHDLVWQRVECGLILRRGAYPARHQAVIHVELIDPLLLVWPRKAMRIHQGEMPKVA